PQGRCARRGDNPGCFGGSQGDKHGPHRFRSGVGPGRFWSCGKSGETGGNVTGYSDIAADLAQKRLALLSEVVPRMSRVGVLRHADNPGSRIASKELESAAPQIGLKLYHVDVRHAADLEAAFTTSTRAHVQSLYAI